MFLFDEIIEQRHEHMFIYRDIFSATTLSGKDNRFLLTNLLGDTIIIV